MKVEKLISKLRETEKISLIPEKSSAVIIPLIEISGEVNVVFTVRSKSLRFQPGEVCFPGGRIEKGESALEAALRELKEELLISEGVHILCSLAPMFGPTGAAVYPFVALLHEYDMTYSPSEVDQVFTYPLSYFKDHPPVRYPMQKRTFAPDNFPYRKVTDGADTYEWHIQKYDMWIYEDTYPVIWGFTGRLLHEFLEML
ncbi:NUDIX hydrolase [Butyrivibrio sp. JL13D10]|uniref:NUDIX hydrolase n=1 Tax=Butyrivibrio sp. JL13D10 TaxID=3236815 RepID=UPI0038B4C455